MAKNEPTKVEMAARIKSLTRQVAGAKTRASRFGSRWAEAAELNLLYHDYVVCMIASKPPIASETCEAGGQVYNFELRLLKNSPKYYIVELAASKAYFDVYFLDAAVSYFRGRIKKPLYSRFSFKCRTIPGYEAVIEKLAVARSKRE